jgi:hypothetical protein
MRRIKIEDRVAILVSVLEEVLCLMLESAKLCLSSRNDRVRDLVRKTFTLT